MKENGPSPDAVQRLKRALQAVDQMQAKLEAIERARREPIAIVGLGCRFPGGADDPAAYWRLLRDGVDAIRRVPLERWDAERYYAAEPQAPGKCCTREGAFLDQIDQFDADFFGISPREARSLDPQQRLLLEVSWEALENAGQAPPRLAGTRTGVFLGIGQNDYAQFELHDSDLSRLQPYAGSGNGFAFASGRLSYVLGLRGPNMAVDTACSSSLVAVHLACQSLRLGECALALAGGVHLSLLPFGSVFLSQTGGLAPDGRCKTFDAAANGFSRGEGCGMIVLKRLSDAAAAGDMIRAIIRGSAVNHDGASGGLMVPSEAAQEALLREALKNARVTPDEISYIEAHGTGTILGDPIEIGALAAVFGPRRQRPLILGSVKTNFGHLEAASGIAGLIKVVLALEQRQIPPHLHFKRPNPHIPWDRLPITIPQKLTEWSAGDLGRMAGVSAFGLSGSNAHVILEEAPTFEAARAKPPLPGVRVGVRANSLSQILTLSARTPPALRELACRYQRYLSSAPAAEFDSICFTANTGRSVFEERLAVVASSAEEAAEALARFLSGNQSGNVFAGRADCTLEYAGPPSSVDSPPADWTPVDGNGEDRVQFLRRLAGQFVRGGQVDWSTVHDEGVFQRVPLPTYPFQRRRHWSDSAKTAVSVLPASPHIHPLVQRRVRSPLKEALFESMLSPSAPEFIREHRVFQHIVFPAAGFVDMALAAGREVLHTEELALGDFTIEQPLIFEREKLRLVQVIISPAETDSASFRIFSAAPDGADEGAAWRPHASGTVCVQKPEPLRINLAAIQARCRETLSLEKFYDDYHQRGVEHGPRFRGVASITRTCGAALSRIRVPESIVSEADRHWMHPAILDACLQTAAAAFPELGEAECYLPFGIDRAQIQARPAVDFWCLAEAAPAGNDRSFLKANLRLLDESGTVWGQIDGFTSRRVTREFIAKNEPEAELLYEVEWQPVVRSSRPPDSSDTRATWVLFADVRGIAASLAASMQARGCRCALVTPGQSFERGPNGNYFLDPGDPKQFRQLLSEVREAAPAKEISVGYFWGIPSDCTMLLAAKETLSGREMPFSDPSPLTLSPSDGAREAPPGSFPGIKHAPWRPFASCEDFRPPESGPDLDKSSRLACEGLVHLVQALTETPPSAATRVWLLTCGAQPAGSDDRLNPAAALLWGLGRTMANEHPELRPVCLDLELDPARIEVEAVVDELLSPGEEPQVALRNGGRFAPRLVRASLAKGRPPDEGEPRQVKLSAYGTLDNLAWQPMTRRKPREDEVEVSIRATGLNLKDVLHALGLLRAESEKLLEISSVAEMPFGFEGAGLVSALGEKVSEFKVGDAVIAAMAPGSLNSFVIVDSAFVVRKPPGLSFAEAATLPIAFLTAQYGLHHLAAIQPGEKVLIHAAAGGVGQAAIQLAQRAGAEVFATASPGKWAFLKAQGVRQIMSSRSLDFADEIMTATQGRGVDVVLNSLAGDFILRSADVLAPGGRFVEIGRQAILTAEQMRRRRPDISYFPFDLGEMARTDPEKLARMFREIIDGVSRGILQPLPHKIFEAGQVIAAFRYMAQARQVGKVIVTQEAAERFQGEKGGETPSWPRPSASRQGGGDSEAAPADSTPLIRGDGTYLITGGLGGLGLVFGRWLAERGARHLVLAGRGSGSPVALSEVSRMRETGASVTVVQADASKPEEVARLLEQIRESGQPLRGIIHAAGLLDDGLIRRLSWDRLRHVFAPKVNGSWNLHEQTRDLDLDFFVLFSSAASLFGSPGQGNYAAANAFLDALAHHRRRLALPALSINWGPWAEAGMAAAMDEPNRRRLAGSGMSGLASKEGLRAFETLLRSGRSQVAVFQADWARIWKTFPALARQPFFDNLRPSSTETPPGFAGLLQNAPAPDRRRLLDAHLRSELGKVLEIPSPHEIDPRRGFFEMGMDSLTSVELRNKLQASLKIELTSTVVFDYSTIEALTGHLCERLWPSGSSADSGLRGELDVVLAAGLDGDPGDDDLEDLLAQELDSIEKDRSHG